MDNPHQIVKKVPLSETTFQKPLAMGTRKPLINLLQFGAIVAFPKHMVFGPHFDNPTLSGLGSHKWLSARRPTGRYPSLDRQGRIYGYESAFPAVASRVIRFGPRNDNDQ
jgi:hypothetical protein